MNRVAADRALIALETCENSLQRLGMLKHILDSPSNVLNNSELDKLKKIAAKKYPATNLSGQKGYDSLRTHAKEITSDFHNHYATLIELPERLKFAKDALIGIFLAMPVIKYQTEPALVALMMDLLVIYIKIHVYVTSLEYKEFLTMFGAAFETNLKILPTNFTMLVDWFSNVTKHGTVYRALHDELSGDLAPVLNGIFKSIKPIMKQFPSAAQPDLMKASFENLMKNDFMLLQDVDSLTMPTTKASYQNYLYYDSMVQWVLYGYLVIPEALETEEEIMFLLIETLNQTYLLPVYQNVTVDIHDEFQNLLKWWPEKKSKYKMPIKASKFQKLLPESERTAIISCGTLHTVRRCFLRTTLASLVKLFSTQPGLMAPQAPVIFAALALAKSEVMWYFHHWERPPTGKSTSFFGGNTLDGYEKETYKDMKITALISHFYDLSNLTQVHSSLISKYYVAYLRGCHRNQLSNLLAAGVSAPNIQSSCSSLVEALGTLTENHDLRPLRLDWFRSLISDNMKLDSVTPVVKRMNAVFVASLFVDSFLETLVQRTSLKDLWWYMPTKLEPVFQNCVNFSSGEPKYCITLMYVINDAANNIYKSCPEEQDLLSNAIVTKADNLLAFLSRNIAARAHEFAHMLYDLEDQGSALQGALRMELAAKAKLLNKLPPPELKPGLESQPGNLSQIVSLYASNRSLVEMCSSMAKITSILVFNKVYYPPEYLYDVLKELVRDNLRVYSFIAAADGGTQLERPTFILNQIKHLNSVMRVIDAHVELGVGDIMRQVLFNECHHPLLSIPGGLIPVESSAYDDKRTLIDGVSMWFVHFIESLSSMEPGAVPGVSFSKAKNAFVKWQPSSTKIQAELFVDSVELRALCEVVGTSGLRVIDAHLIRLIYMKLKKVKELLVANAKDLQNFVENWTGPHVFLYAKGVHNVMYLNRDLTVIGNALALRRLLHAAAGDVSQVRSKAIRTCLRDALESHEYKAVWENTRITEIARETSFINVDVAAYDIGLPVGLKDHKLSSALLSLSTTLWGMLPYAVVASFVDEASWNSAEFLPNIEVHQNNVHVIAIALHEIIKTFMSFEGVNKPEGPVETVKQKMHEFIRMATLVLLRMKEKEKVAFPTLPIRAMFVFLEMVVTEGEKHGTIDRHEMERIFPYSLVHAAYVDMSLGKQRTGDEPLGTSAWDDAGLREELAANAALEK